MIRLDFFFFKKKTERTIDVLTSEKFFPNFTQRMNDKIVVVGWRGGPWKCRMCAKRITRFLKTTEYLIRHRRRSYLGLFNQLLRYLYKNAYIESIQFDNGAIWNTVNANHFGDQGRRTHKGFFVLFWTLPQNGGYTIARCFVCVPSNAVRKTNRFIIHVPWMSTVAPYTVTVIG